jgi:predicted nuclease of predicted toxin-antitoxin system
LRGATDVEIWQYARDNGFVIVSKDSDFSQRSTLFGGAPKIIWLRIGNCTTTRADFVLRNTAGRIQAFFASDEENCLVLSHPRRS